MMVQANENLSSAENGGSDPTNDSSSFSQGVKEGVEAEEQEQEQSKQCCRKVYRGNRNALGFQLDNISKAFARGTQVAFMSTAVLNLANEIAGCPPASSENVCEGRILGLRPSSLLTLYGTITGVVTALFIPIVGAIVDYTPHRLLVGRIMAILFLSSLVPGIFTARSIWGLVAISTTMIAVVIEWSNGIAYAYLPEMAKTTSSPNNDKTIYNGWIASFVAMQSGSMAIFIIVNIAASLAFGYNNDNIALARISSAATFLLGIPIMGVAWWRLFKPCHALRSLSNNNNKNNKTSALSYVTIGFVQVYKTSQTIARNYTALKWFYIQVAFADGFIVSFPTFAVTYLTDTFGFSGQQNGIVALLVLIFGCIGAVVGKWYNTRRNPIESCIAASLWLIVLSSIIGFIYSQPGPPVIFLYILGGMMGLGFGWKRCSDEYLAALLVPQKGDQDAELMGFFMFVRLVLTWMGPLLFTGLNEIGTLRLSHIIVIITIIMCGLSIFALWRMGDFEAALAVASAGVETSHGDDDDDETDNNMDVSNNKTLEKNEMMEAEASHQV